ATLEGGPTVCETCKRQCISNSIVEADSKYRDMYGINLAHLTQLFFCTGDRSDRFYDKFVDHTDIGGYFGMVGYLTKMAKAFTGVEMEDNIKWDGEWSEAGEAFVDRVVSEALDKDLLSDSRLKEIAEEAINWVFKKY